MRDDGWVGKYAHSLWRADRDYPGGPRGIVETEPGPGHRPLLYDATGRPLVRARVAGFIRSAQ